MRGMSVKVQRRREADLSPAQQNPWLVLLRRMGEPDTRLAWREKVSPREIGLLGQ